MLGKAAVAMWWDIAPDMKAEFEDWHTHEHMPERLAIPGFLRGMRWISGHPFQRLQVGLQPASLGITRDPLNAYASEALAGGHDGLGQLVGW